MRMPSLRRQARWRCTGRSSAVVYIRFRRHDKPRVDGLLLTLVQDAALPRMQLRAQEVVPSAAPQLWTAAGFFGTQRGSVGTC